MVTFEIMSAAMFLMLFNLWPAWVERGYALAKLLGWLAPATGLWLLAAKLRSASLNARLVTARYASSPGSTLHRPDSRTNTSRDRS